MSKSSANISTSVIRRLPRYYRFLGELASQGVTKISSKQLSEKMKVTASQIRQDLNCFGGFGQQGYGYNVQELRAEIGKILGVGNKHKAVLIGAGNLGTAISVHINFDNSGFKLIGIFDSNEKIIGNEIVSTKISHIDDFESFCQKYKPEVAVLCVPQSAAKGIIDKAINMGIKCFWNFSHYDINLNYDNVIVENVHLSDSLMTLSYGVNNMLK